MPYVDKRTGNIVVRVVYDGAPEAGKTTNLVALTERMPVKRRSGLVSPGTEARRTEYFDWLTFQGGFVDGRRLQCQLVSVPGQPSLLRRRRYLIDSADAIVFVADSRPGQVSNGRYAFELMHKAVLRRGGTIPASVLLQANKQDLPTSLTPEDLAKAMNIADDVTVIGAEAQNGIGVMETFVQAVRQATRRVRELLLSGAPWEEDGAQEVSPEELLMALERVEKELDGQQLDMGIAPRQREARGIVPRPRVYVLGDVESAQDSASAKGSERASAHPPVVPFEDGAGHVWPLVMGRRVFAEVAGGAPTRALKTRAWAPPRCDEVEIAGDGVVRWILHTTSDWQFEDTATGRVKLLELVGHINDLGSWRPPGRALSLQVEGDGARLFMVTAAVPTLREALHEAVERAQTTASVGSLVRALVGALVLTEDELPRLRLPCAHLDGIGISYERAVVLAIPGLEESVDRSTRDELFSLLGRLGGLGMSAGERAATLSWVEDRSLAVRLDDWMAREVRAGRDD